VHPLNREIHQHRQKPPREGRKDTLENLKANDTQVGLVEPGVQLIQFGVYWASSFSEAWIEW
jgi:hypothetical protein